MSYADLFILVIPETIIVITALLVLGLDLTVMRQRPNQTRVRTSIVVTSLGCLLAMLWMNQAGDLGRIFGGMVFVNVSTVLVKQVILVLSIFTALLCVESDFTDHVGEYFALLLLATVGMMFLVSTENLLLLFVSLELLSLCLYIMTAFHKQNIKSAEAALKYFLFGGMSAAFMLFGLSLIYGVSGAIYLPKIAQNLAGAPLDPLTVVAMVMIVIGFGFKVAAAPFHLWAPDAYQGAPLPSAAFIASGSKVASFFVLARVMMVGFAGTEGSGAWREFAQGWIPLIAVVAGLSVVLGNLAALAQDSVRRLLA